MTKIDDTDDDLAKKLQETQKIAQEKDETEKNDSDSNQQTDVLESSDLETKLSHLESQLKEKDEITKKAQHDYISLKIEFDSYMTRQENQKKQDKIQTLFDIARKFLPLVQSLDKTISNIPEENKDTPLAQWVMMSYKSALSQLESLSIFPIESLWLIPDANLHEPLTTQPTDDENLKGKIIQEYEKGFVYRKDGEQKVVITSKVVVGA